MYCSQCRHENSDDPKVCLECRFEAGSFFAGRYEILNEGTSGETGLVYRAHDLDLDEEVALKVVHPRLAASQTAAQRIRQEARLARRLSHRNIVRVHDFGSLDGLVYLTMEWVQGRTLRELIDGRKAEGRQYSIGEALGLLMPVMEALRHIHEYSVHRDVRPEKILVTDGPGAVRAMLLGPKAGDAQAKPASPYYTAPEMAQGPSAVDKRADIYSLGVILYEMVTGGMPVGRWLNKPGVGPSLPGAFEDLIDRALSPRPDSRYRDMDEMLAAAGAILAIPETTAEVPPEPDAAPEPVQEAAPPGIPVPDPPRAVLEGPVRPRGRRGAVRFTAAVFAAACVLSASYLVFMERPVKPGPAAGSAGTQVAGNKSGNEPPTRQKASREIAVTKGSEAEALPAAITAGTAVVPDAVKVITVSRAAEQPKPADIPAMEEPPPARETVNPKDGYELVYIPGGYFWMGSPEGEGYARERQRHMVYLDGYYMGRYPVTVRQYRRFCRETGREMPRQPDWSAEDHPVVNVSWRDAQGYADWADMRLPTEAEWEKSARGGKDTRYYWGSDPTHDMANYGGTGGRDRWGKSSPVGSFRPNGFGLYDMAGNVWQWCSDWFGEDYYRFTAHTNPKGPASGDTKALRGGSWSSPAECVSCGQRFKYYPDIKNNYTGFRLARTK